LAPAYAERIITLRDGRVVDGALLPAWLAARQSVVATLQSG